MQSFYCPVADLVDRAVESDGPTHERGHATWAAFVEKITWRRLSTNGGMLL